MSASRSRAFRGARVDFKPIDPVGLSDRELLEKAVLGINQTHLCVHDFREAQSKHNATARQQRIKMARELATVKRRQANTDGQVSLITLAMGARAPEAGEVKPKAAKADVSWKGALKIASAVGGALSLLVFVVQLTVHAGPAALAYIMGLSPT